MFGVLDMQSQIKMLTRNILNMVIFEKFKTGNTIADTMLTTIILMIMTYGLQFINEHIIENINIKKLLFYNIFNFVYKKNIIEYEGKISSSTNFYDNKINNSSAFSDRFKALWAHIIDNIGNNLTINNIKEFSFTNPSRIYLTDKRDLGIYMVIQNEQFLISKELEIYAYTNINSETQELDDKESIKKTKSCSKIEKIRIELFSYKSSVKQIKDFVETLTLKYLTSIEDLRENKKFIYTLIKTKYEDNISEMWSENEFSSTRTFRNLFFSGKNNVIDKIDFFLNNKEWYYEMGIPYSLGIGMSGPPGTGKTSLIKAIANHTRRHVIVISLKLIKTKRQLDNIFFEERYNLDNKKGSINFDKKIIVFEDIDCIGDIVLDREKKKKSSTTGLGNKLNFQELTTNSKINIGDLLETIAASDNDLEKKGYQMPKLPLEDEPITLDDILNLWDGIRETPGRIMIISSNHYYDLDPALIRPGRIDLTLELSNATHEIIKDIYFHLFKEKIDVNDERILKIQDKFYSPAEIMNIYMNEERNKDLVLERLIKNEHV
jgi:ATP-dependent 26S proteasome regulatory subunit